MADVFDITGVINAIQNAYLQKQTDLIVEQNVSLPEDAQITPPPELDGKLKAIIEFTTTHILNHIDDKIDELINERLNLTVQHFPIDLQSHQVSVSRKP